MSDAGSRLGLSHQLKAETEVLQTTLSGRKSLGRVADLLLAWLGKRKINVPASVQTSLRIYTQVLVEVAAPPERNELGHFEFAIEENRILMSVRYPHSLPNATVTDGIDAFEKEVTQFWMSSARSAAIRKNLGAQDRVEVRHHSKMNVTEWRLMVLLDANANTTLGSGFAVFLDGTEKIESIHGKVTDLGDLPYDSLMQEVYRSGSAPSKSGEMRFQGAAVQEEEHARLQFEKEVDTIHSETLDEGSPEEDQKSTDAYLEELVNRLRADQVEIKGQAKEAIRAAKQQELESKRHALLSEQKIKKYEDLLKRKELNGVRLQNQVKILNDKLSQGVKAVPADDQSKAFRDKALQMHAMAKKLKEEKEALEKIVAEMIEKERVAESTILNLSQKNQPQDNGLQLDEMTKRADRLQRALEAEKVKVKQLSERLIIAEKESQAAGPQVKDLENKVEQAVKLTQQAKKETEAVKQKVIQAEQEKNKIQNELVKVQAQIVTLQKRQAA